MASMIVNISLNSDSFDLMPSSADPRQTANESGCRCLSKTLEAFHIGGTKFFYSSIDDRCSE